MALTPAAAALACTTITEEEIAAFDGNLERTRRVVAEEGSFTDLDLEFHAMIAGATRNRAWLLAREPAAMLLFPATVLMRPHLPQAGRWPIEAHAHIIAARDAAVAEESVRKHVVDLRRGYESAGIALNAPVGAEATPHKRRQSQP